MQETHDLCGGSIPIDMTATEAKQKTDVAIQRAIDMDAVYEYIDSMIENAIKHHQYKVNLRLECKDIHEEVALYRREKVVEHYNELGYEATYQGFNICTKKDFFEISWKNNIN